MKQTYKLKLLKKWRIHDIFYVSLLEQDTLRKRQEFSVPEFEPGDNKEYKMETILDSAIYAKEADRQLPELYYLVAWKGYPEEKSIWELFLAVIYFWKLLSKFHHKNLIKLTTTSPPIDTTLSMAKLTIQLPAKRKQGWLTRHAQKRAK